jgi:hypothetical protein
MAGADRCAGLLDLRDRPEYRTREDRKANRLAAGGWNWKRF